MSSAFTDFLAPLRAESVFQRSARTRLPLQSGAGSCSVKHLLTWEKLTAMAAKGANLSQVRFYTNRKRIPFSFMRSGQEIDEQLAKRVVKSGGSIMMEAAHQFDDDLAEIVKDYLDMGGKPVRLAAIGSTGECGALPKHSDPIDLFVRQVAGAKRWRIYSPEEPEGNQGTGTPLKEIVLREGDYLFLPAGMPHECDTIDGNSLHLTLGFMGKNYNVWG